MFSKSAYGPADHAGTPAGFTRTADVARDRSGRRLSVAVFAVLALAVLASAAALPIEDGTAHRGQSAAWDMSRAHASPTFIGG